MSVKWIYRCPLADGREGSGVIAANRPTEQPENLGSRNMEKPTSLLEKEIGMRRKKVFLRDGAHA
jgi:hypothetical protein